MHYPCILSSWQTGIGHRTAGPDFEPGPKPIRLNLIQDGKGTVLSLYITALALYRSTLYYCTNTCGLVERGGGTMMNNDERRQAVHAVAIRVASPFRVQTPFELFPDTVGRADVEPGQEALAVSRERSRQV